MQDSGTTINGPPIELTQASSARSLRSDSWESFMRAVCRLPLTPDGGWADPLEDTLPNFGIPRSRFDGTVQHPSVDSLNLDHIG